jgi:hypothetical protein
MIQMTHRTSLTIVVKAIDLNTNCIYSHKHMVRMDKISFSDKPYVIFKKIQND